MLGDLGKVVAAGYCKRVSTYPHFDRHPEFASTTVLHFSSMERIFGQMWWKLSQNSFHPKTKDINFHVNEFPFLNKEMCNIIINLFKTMVLSSI